MINNYTNNLYKELMNLCDSNEAFYFKDFPTGNDAYVYRIFNYRLANYTDFCQPSALECRGTMFIVGEDSVELASLPMEKFFNDGENPFTQNVDYTDPRQVMVKEDGSLISTYFTVDRKLALKSKGSISSEQAYDAMAHIANDGYLAHALNYMTLLGFTVNMEWCAPHNRIVLHYDQPQLIILNVRDMATGEYVNYTRFWDDEFLDKYCVKNASFVSADDIRSQEGYEGVIVQLNSGQHVKIKTDWYVTLHHAKDSVNNPKALIRNVLEETTDDLRQLFVDDQVALERIRKYEDKIDHAFNHVMNLLERYHEFEGKKDRKTYAIHGQEYWDDDKKFFGCQMKMYEGQDVSDMVKAQIMKHYKEYLIDEDMNVNFEENE